MFLQLDTETEGAYLFCKSQGFAWGKCLQKGGNKISHPIPASIRGKGQVRKTRLCFAGQGGFWEERKGLVGIIPVAASLGYTKPLGNNLHP